MPAMKMNKFQEVAEKKEKFSTHRMCRVFRTKIGENEKRSLGTGVVKYHATGYEIVNS